LGQRQNTSQDNRTTRILQIMNPTIDKLWEEANDQFDKDLANRVPFDGSHSVRSYLVCNKNDVWGSPLKEIVQIVYDDIEGMPWSRDSRDIKEASVDGYIDDLRDEIKKKIDWRRCARGEM